jgi:exosortase A-associated hydrolase 2
MRRVDFVRRPGFVAGPNGSLFVLETLPEAERLPTAVLVLAPFAEEMNRSRRMLTLQSESLARQGVRTLLFDYSGTGDSEGDFGGARVSAWLNDARAVAEHARRTGSESVLWLGVRFGALLGMDLLRSVPTSAGMVLWQPTHSGRQLVKQLQRLQAAVRMSVGATSRATAGPDGENVEIAGYEVSAGLLSDIGALELASQAPAETQRLAWYEIGQMASDALGPGSRHVIEVWAQRGVKVECRTVPGDPFWATVEVTTALPLIELTTETFSTWARHE